MKITGKIINGNIDADLFLPQPVIEVNNGLVEIEGEGEIYYTLDGTVPDFRSKKYSRKFTINEDCFIKAISYNGQFYSNITTLQVEGNKQWESAVHITKSYYNGDSTQFMQEGPIKYYQEFKGWTLYLDVAMCETYEQNKNDVFFYEIGSPSNGGFRFGFRGTDEWKVYPFIQFFGKQYEVKKEEEFKFCLLERYKSAFKIIFNSDGKLGVMNYKGNVQTYNFDISLLDVFNEYSVPSFYIGIMGGLVSPELGKYEMSTRDAFIHINQVKTESRCNNNFSDYFNLRYLVLDIIRLNDGFIQSSQFGVVYYKYNDGDYKVMYDQNHILEAEQPTKITATVDYFGKIDSKTKTLGVETNYIYQEQEKIGDIITEEQTLYTTTELDALQFLGVEILEATDDTPVISFLFTQQTNKKAGFKLYNTKYQTLNLMGVATTNKLDIPLNGQKLSIVCISNKLYLYYGQAFIDTGITLTGTFAKVFSKDVSCVINNKTRLLSYAVRTGENMLYYPPFYQSQQ